MTDFRMPSLGADMEAGTLVEWHVKPGDSVKRGDIVALVETQKGIVEIEIWDTGIVEALVVSPGSKVPVGTVLATLRSEGVQPEHERASPAARHLARELGIDLAKVHGTGPHGVITRSDVEGMKAPIAKPAAPSNDAMRRAIASAMSRSKREIPHYYLSAEIDVTHAMQWLEAKNATRPVTERVLFAALLLRTTARALAEFPDLNGFFVDGSHHPAPAVHLGVAISLRGGGLIAPAIHDAHTKSLEETMSALKDLVARARSGTLRGSELSDPTITVSNLGDQGVDTVFGIIYPPQVALVGFGRPREQPWAENGMIGVRKILTATLAGDHRASDGHRGALFLSALARLLAEPENA